MQGPYVTHLCFADDLLVFMNGDVTSANALATALNIFSARTGIVVNNNKSNIFMSSLDSITSYGIKTFLGFQMGTLPVKYLGLPLLSTRLSQSDCIPLFHHVTSRIKSWKVRVLSYAGRVLLIKVVLSSMLIFWTACFVLPKKTINCLNTLFRNFLWAGIDLTYKQPAVSWTIICHPYKEGGLGIRCIETTNTAANLRHIWDIVRNKDTLWVQWVSKNLIKKKDFWFLTVPYDCSWCWRRILDHRELARKYILSLIGNGESTSLWKDVWLRQGNLMNIFPTHMSYDSAHNADAKVSSCLVNGHWHLSPNLSHALGEVSEAITRVKTDRLLEDKIVWTAGHSGDYTLKETYNALRHKNPILDWNVLLWFPHCIPRHWFIVYPGS